MIPQTITVWIAYYADGSDYALFGSEVEALRHAIENGMRVMSQDMDVLTGYAEVTDSGQKMPQSHRVETPHA